jgi:glycylpeptide N-tetradecanoyltransferase
MDNEDVLKQLKFGPGDGNLHYYLYNWKCPVMSKKDIGLVLM